MSSVASIAPLERKEPTGVWALDAILGVNLDCGHRVSPHAFAPGALGQVINRRPTLEKISAPSWSASAPKVLLPDRVLFPYGRQVHTSMTFPMATPGQQIAATKLPPSAASAGLGWDAGPEKTRPGSWGPDRRVRSFVSWLSSSGTSPMRLLAPEGQPWLV